MAGEHFDVLILATDTVGANTIMQASPALAKASPELAAQLSTLRPGQRYAVWRLWIDRDLRSDLPVFISTERLCVLDSVTLRHRIGGAPRLGETGVGEAGAVLELHCYSVPDALDEQALRDAFVRELSHYFPELVGFQIRHQVLQLRADFSAFHVNMAYARPGTESGLRGLYLAGDWVRLPCPAMLMEAAYTSSLLATNAILQRLGLRPYPVLSVPQRGLLFSLRQKKLKARALRAAGRARPQPR